MSNSDLHALGMAARLVSTLLGCDLVLAGRKLAHHEADGGEHVDLILVVAGAHHLVVPLASERANQRRDYEKARLILTQQNTRLLGSVFWRMQIGLHRQLVVRVSTEEAVGRTIGTDAMLMAVVAEGTRAEVYPVGLLQLRG